MLTLHRVGVPGGCWSIGGSSSFVVMASSLVLLAAVPAVGALALHRLLLLLILEKRPCVHSLFKFLEIFPKREASGPLLLLKFRAFLAYLQQQLAVDVVNLEAVLELHRLVQTVLQTLLELSFPSQTCLLEICESMDIVQRAALSSSCMTLVFHLSLRFDIMIILAKIFALLKYHLGILLCAFWISLLGNLGVFI